MQAKNEVKQLDLYTMDLLWSIAQRNLQSDVPMPSEIWTDKRTAKQIMKDLIKGLGGD